MSTPSNSLDRQQVKQRLASLLATFKFNTSEGGFAIVGGIWVKVVSSAVIQDNSLHMFVSVRPYGAADLEESAVANLRLLLQQQIRNGQLPLRVECTDSAGCAAFCCVPADAVCSLEMRTASLGEVLDMVLQSQGGAPPRSGRRGRSDGLADILSELGLQKIVVPKPRLRREGFTTESAEILTRTQLSFTADEPGAESAVENRPSLPCAKMQFRDGKAQLTQKEGPVDEELGPTWHLDLRLSSTLSGLLVAGQRLQFFFTPEGGAEKLLGEIVLFPLEGLPNTLAATLTISKADLCAAGRLRIHNVQLST